MFFKYTRITYTIGIVNLYGDLKKTYTVLDMIHFLPKK